MSHRLLTHTVSLLLAGSVSLILSPITPTHVQRSVILATNRGDNTLEDDKPSLVKLRVEEAAAYSNLPAVSRYSTMEKLPRVVGSGADLMGDYALDQFFRVRTLDRPVPAKFGMRLAAAANSDPYVVQQRETRAVAQKRFSVSTPGLPILVYHQIISPDATGQVDYSTAITLKKFTEQMRYLHAQGYNTLSMDEVVRYLKGKAFPANVVAIHVDDGWKSARQMLPVLDRYGFKATFWIIAGVGNEEGSPHLNRAELLALARHPRIEMYSHTMTHPWREGETLLDWVQGDTPGKGLAQARRELTESRAALERTLGHPVRYLAWPRGLYNDRLIDLAKDAGYEALLTIDDGVNHRGDDLMRIRRTIINGACDIDTFKQVVKDGIYRAC